MDQTRMLFKVGTQWQLESGRYDLLTVHTEADYREALAAGWFDDQYKAKDALEDAPPTRAELEQRARQLGIKFDGRTSDKKLADLIEAKG